MLIRIWELFSYWYPTNGHVVKRNRIEYENQEPTQSSNLEIGTTKGKMAYEIEIYPVFFHYFSFEEISKIVKNISLEGIKEHLSSVSESKNVLKLLTFSKITKYKEILASLESIYKYNNVKTRYVFG